MVFSTPEAASAKDYHKLATVTWHDMQHLTCAQNLVGSQLSLLHGVRTKQLQKRKLKQKNQWAQEIQKQSETMKAVQQVAYRQFVARFCGTDKF